MIFLTNSRRKAVSIKLNVDELYLLGDRIIWKIDKFLSLKRYVFKNDKNMIKKIKVYVELLDKICNMLDAKPFLNDITIKFTASEIALIWEVLSKLDSVVDPLHDPIDAVNRCDVFYKDLSYSQIVNIYLYTEFAFAMRDSGNRNIYIDGPLLRVRSTYIYEYLSNYKYIYEFKDIDASDLHMSLFIIEPRYEKPGADKVSLKDHFKCNKYSLFNITLKDLRKAQDTLSNLSVDYEYIDSLNQDGEELSEGILDEIDCMINEAKRVLLHNDYGPGWRLNLHFYDVFDTNGDQVKSFDLDEETFNRFDEIDFIRADTELATEERLADFVSERIKIINKHKARLNGFYSMIQYLNGK